MDLLPPQPAAWPDLVALALFAGCAVTGAIVLVQSLRPEPDERTASVPDDRLRESLRGAGYELLSVSRGYHVSAGAIGEFGFRGRSAGRVRRLRVKTWDGSVREGWLSDATAPALQTVGASGRRRPADCLEITWDY